MNKIISYRKVNLGKHSDKSKGKVLPRTGHESPEGEQRYNSTLSLTVALYGGGW
jgi:hypothetical protein